MNSYWKSNSIVVLFQKSGKMSGYIFLFYYWIRRDWRGSNPQLPPWQGGALTNWTTIPGNYSIEYPVFLWFDWKYFELAFSCCNRATSDILISTWIYTLVRTTPITSKFSLFQNQVRINLSIKKKGFLFFFLFRV